MVGSTQGTVQHAQMQSQCLCKSGTFVFVFALGLSSGSSGEGLKLSVTAGHVSMRLRNTAGDVGNHKRYA